LQLQPFHKFLKQRFHEEANVGMKGGEKPTRTV